MSARISPAMPPFAPSIQAALDRIMPAGTSPLVLFTTLARDERLCGKFFAGGLLDKGHLTLRQREIVIHRITARSGSRYEFTVHMGFFGPRVGFGDAEFKALAHGAPDDACWTPPERALIAFCDALHDTCDVDEALWASLAAHLGPEAMLEVLLVAGFYRTVSYLTNALRLPLEPFAPAYPG
jgi:alkylhydroperoxidase family enzyme